MEEKALVSIGKKFEVFTPYWNKNLIGLSIATLFFGAFFFILIMIFPFNLLFGIIFGALVASMIKSFLRKNHHITFHEKGLHINSSESGEVIIPLDMIEDFDWQGDDVTETEGDHYGAYSVERFQDISFQISWEEDGQFRELDWTETFPKGSIERLQRACARMEDIENTMEEEDEFWDE